MVDGCHICIQLHYLIPCSFLFRCQGLVISTLRCNIKRQRDVLMYQITCINLPLQLRTGRAISFLATKPSQTQVSRAFFWFHSFNIDRLSCQPFQMKLSQIYFLWSWHNTDAQHRLATLSEHWMYIQLVASHAICQGERRYSMCIDWKHYVPCCVWFIGRESTNDLHVSTFSFLPLSWRRYTEKREALFQSPARFSLKACEASRSRCSTFFTPRFTCKDWMRPTKVDSGLFV